MSWNAPQTLLLLWLVPGLAIAMIVAAHSRRNALARLGDPELIGRLMASRDPRKRFLKNVLVLFSVAAAIVALAQPQTLSRKVNVTRAGIDLMIVADVSLSMLADDMPPSRMEFSKTQLDRLIAAAPAERIGLIAFSGGTQVLSPLTSDKTMLRKLLGELRPDNVPVRGSMLGVAMQAGVNAFVEKQRKARILLLITDGEDFTPFPIHLAEQAKNEGIRLFVVGVGRPEGHTIPLSIEGGSTELMLDGEGKLVYTSLNEALLMKIAEVSGGTYYAAYDSEETCANLLLRDFDSIQKTEAFQDVVVEHENHFQWPMLAAVITLLIEVSLSERKRLA